MIRLPMVVVRGGGDLASGVIYKLHQCGFPVFILECEQPSAIRRRVSFCEAVYTNTTTVEKLTCERVFNIMQGYEVLKKGNIPLLVDPKGDSIQELQPTVVVDAILAKRNIGTNIDMADVVIGLGPGFTAGKDVDMVVETKRGHRLGSIYITGSAIANTGVPGVIEGYGKERVIHAPAFGVMKEVAHIGDIVEQGQCIAYIEDCEVQATITGVLRGILRTGYVVSKGMKMADIDPRKEEVENCNTISEKARCIAGGVVEAILYHLNKRI